MIDNRGKKRSAQLGVPWGTANARLRKNILFHLLQKHGENVCSVCKKIIETKNELSIEHIKPWEDRDPNLFWDLDNIAFSHILCNKPHNLRVDRELYKKSPNVIRHQTRPEGTAWCVGHRMYLDVSLFHSNARNPDGVASYCKECRSASPEK